MEGVNAYKRESEEVPCDTHRKEKSEVAEARE